MSLARQIAFGAAFAAALAFAFPAPTEKTVFEDGGRRWAYQTSEIEGWKVHVHESLVGDAGLVRDLERELKAGLVRIREVIRPEIVKLLVKVPVFVSDEADYPMREGERGVIPFHRSPEWLRDHGLNPHMAPGVHVINPRAVLYDHKVFEWAPMTILHELSHAYHNLHLKLDHPGIDEAYQAAMVAGLYQEVPSRSDPDRKVKAYAATNKEEYFAELTEAYFGTNDWFPRTRDELRGYDPAGYRMIEDAWKAKAPTNKR